MANTDKSFSLSRITWIYENVEVLSPNIDLFYFISLGDFASIHKLTMTPTIIVQCDVKHIMIYGYKFK